jgi:hypothetical protein
MEVLVILFLAAVVLAGFAEVASGIASILTLLFNKGKK